MQLSDMVSAINRRVDDIVSQTDAIEWLNAGKHQMEIASNSSYPDIDGKTILTYAFPEEYHILPVIYAAAQYQGANLLRQQYMDLMAEFKDGLSYFVERYRVPPQYRNGTDVQQFTAQAGQLAYIITAIDYDPNSADVRMFINGIESFDFQRPTGAATNPASVVTTLTTTNDPRGVIFNDTTTINAGDAVTAQWELHADMIEAPYPWWRW